MSDIFNQAYLSAKEIIEVADLSCGNILVIGCSTSEVVGSKIGTDSKPDTAFKAHNSFSLIISCSPIP